MAKRILFTLMTLLVSFSLALVVFVSSEPVAVADNISDVLNNPLDYDTLQEYTISSGPSAIHYYYFCTADSNDCVYVANTVMKGARESVGSSVINLIEYVDLSGLDEEQRLTRLSNDWGISTYPAFVACHVENGQIVIDNSLLYEPDKPLSSEDLISWLSLNGLCQTATASASAS